MVSKVDGKVCQCTHPEIAASRHSTARVHSARVRLISLPGAAVYAAMTIQMIAFVGLSTVATAASTRAIRRLRTSQRPTIHTVLQ
jgi:membrane protein implicated in regulation of membrane protease activity